MGSPFEKVLVEIKKASMLIDRVEHKTELKWTGFKENPLAGAFRKWHVSVLHTATNEAAGTLFALLAEMEDVVITLAERAVLVECALTKTELENFMNTNGDLFHHRMFEATILAGLGFKREE